VIDLACFQRQDRGLAGQEADLLAREREVAAQGERLVQVSAIAQSMTQVLNGLRVGLGQASFEQRRQLVELLIDRVVVTDGQVEIRYVIPTTDHSTKTRFCHLRTDYFHLVALPVAPAVKGRRPATPWAPPGPVGLLILALGMVWRMRPPTTAGPRHPYLIHQPDQLGGISVLARGQPGGQVAAAAVADGVHLGGQPAP